MPPIDKFECEDTLHKSNCQLSLQETMTYYWEKKHNSRVIESVCLIMHFVLLFVATYLCVQFTHLFVCIFVFAIKSMCLVCC